MQTALVVSLSAYLAIAALFTAAFLFANGVKKAAWCLGQGLIWPTTIWLMIKDRRDSNSSWGGAQGASIDMTSNEEKELRRNAVRGKSLGPAADLYIKELIDLHHRQGLRYKDETDGEWKDNARARSIGEDINALGGGGQSGLRLMKAVAYRVCHVCGEVDRPGFPGSTARITLEACWDGIGDWKW